MSSTAALARRLGAVRTRRIRSLHDVTTAAQNGGIAPQPFQFLLVLDFESTCWDKPQNKYDVNPPSEIIEFPVVLVATDTGAVLDEFRHYVQPVEHPQLSAFCKGLTGIQQAEVDDGVPLPTAVMLFKRWLVAAAEKNNFVVNDVRPGKKSATFVTWSDWDLAVCLAYECRRKQLNKPDCFAAWCDLRLVYSKFYSRRPQGLNGALQDVGISFEGREHSGLCDAKNTAKLAFKMIQDGCVIPVTKFLNPKLVHDRFKKMQINTVLKLPGLKQPAVTPPVTPQNKMITPAKENSSKSASSSFKAPLKRTPPMCGCGRRSRFCLVQSPGMNQGRGFYACPRGRGAQGNCRFFKWESDIGQSPKLKQRNINTFMTTPNNSTVEESPSPKSTISMIKMASVTTSPAGAGQQYFGNVPMFTTPASTMKSRSSGAGKENGNCLGQSFIQIE